MPATVSLKGIDEAIGSLGYTNPQALKYKLVQAIRRFYQDESALQSLRQINPDALIKAMWNTGNDSAAAKVKRKNLSSTKSSVNTDLKKLFKEGKNPEGVIIGRDNVFVMSDEAKDKLISTFGGEGAEGQAASLQEITQALKALKRVLSSAETAKDKRGPQASATLEELRDTIERLSQSIGTGHKESAAYQTPEEPAALENRAAGDGQRIGSNRETKQETPAEPLDGTGNRKVADATKEPATGKKQAIDQSDDGPDSTHNVNVETVVEEVLSAEALEEPGLGKPAEQTQNIEARESTEDQGIIDNTEVVDAIVGPHEAPRPLDGLEADAIEDDDLQEVLEAIDVEEVDEDAHVCAEARDFNEEEVFDDVVADEDLEQVEVEQEAETAEDIETLQALGEEVIADDAEVADEALKLDDVPDELDVIEDDDLEDVFEALDGDDMDDEALASAWTQDIDENAIEEDLGGAVSAGDFGKAVLPAGAGALDVPEGKNCEQTNEQASLPVRSPGEESGLDENTDSNKRKRLAEVFDGYLGTMERFYNQYLVVPAGNYRLGSKSPKKEERQEQTVRVASFYMGKFPVTNALFEVFVENTGYVTTAEKAGFGTVYHGRLCKEVDNKTGAVRFRCNGTVQSKTVKGAFWYQPFGPGSTLHLKRTHPVVQVSLADATAFAAWTGKRLPSEDEWEAAARTEMGYVYPWGDDWQTNACNTEDSAVADTTPVDTFKEMTNAFDVVDTLGNVLEWTSDIFPSAHNPTHSSTYHVAKGGSWVSEKDVCLFSRFKIKADAPSNILGFRCVAD